LITTDWLAGKLQNPGIVIIDMSDETQHSRFHLPGARHLPYDAINQRTKTGVSLSAGSQHISRILGLLGIDNSKHIIIYDDMAGLHASRLFWELERLGHKEISILDGGLVKWILEGRKITNQPSQFARANYQPNGTGRDNLASLVDIRAVAEQKSTVLLDVRSQEEYTGHPAYQRTGHIPGARWWEWEQAANFAQGFTMQPDKQVITSLTQAGMGKKETPAILYCQSGHRAAHTYFTLRRLGYTKVRVFDGSMAEYGQHKSLPLNRGQTP
ncbi:MAG: sulfurtransferase, partial [Gammaproteobacteria bacterium]|nr:sulfurtransferase [Gammaproteobacteria bacterium]